MSKEIGQIIYKRRTDLHLYQKDLADICGVSPSTVGRWENGDTESIKRGNLYLLSKTLYIPIEVLLGIEPASNTKNIETIVLKKQLHTLIDQIDDIDKLKKIGQILGSFIEIKT